MKKRFSAAVCALLLCAGLPFSPGREELAFSPAVHLNEVVRAVRKGAAADAGWSALAGPLAGALETLAGAACDVFDKEPPLPADHPLLHTPNTIVTPHIAFASVESMEQRAEIVFENLYSWLDGKQLNAV